MLIGKLRLIVILEMFSGCWLVECWHDVVIFLLWLSLSFKRKLRYRLHGVANFLNVYKANIALSFTRVNGKRMALYTENYTRQRAGIHRLMFQPISANFLQLTLSLGHFAR